MVWVEIEPSWDFEKEEAARTAQTDFVDDGSIPTISDPNLELSKEHINRVRYSTVRNYEMVFYYFVAPTRRERGPRAHGSQARPTWLVGYSEHGACEACS